VFAFIFQHHYGHKAASHNFRDEIANGVRVRSFHDLCQHQNMPPRNQHFHTREPFENDDRLTLHHAEGPFNFLNPTRAHFDHSGLTASSKQSATDDLATSHESGDDINGNAKQLRDDSDFPAKNFRFLWRSRDNRKGRHPLLVQRPTAGEGAPFLTPRRTSHPKEVLKIVIKTFTYFPVWDISWLVAFIFTWGSVVWVMNVGIFAPGTLHLD
jgi:hypothetical protein